MRRAAAALILLLFLAIAPLITNSSTCYRVAITITNENQYDVYNYTLRITIPNDHVLWDYLANLSDSSSIYVTDSQGNPLYYYVEEFDKENKKFKLLVKIPYVAGGSTTTIYMYFGGENPYSEYSDKKKVFLFYEDFDDGVADWNKGSKIASVKEENGWLDIAPVNEHTWNQLEYYKHYWINITDLNIKPPFKIKIHQYVWKHSSNYDLGQCFIAFYDPNGERFLSLGINDWDCSYQSGAHVYFWTKDAGAHSYHVGMGLNHYIEGYCTDSSCYFKSYTDYGTVTEKTLSFSSYTIGYIAITSTKYSGYDYKTHKVDFIIIEAYADTPLSYDISSTVEEVTGGGTGDGGEGGSETGEGGEGGSEDSGTSITVNSTWINVSIIFNFSTTFGTSGKVFYFEDLEWFSITFEPIVCGGKVVLEFSGGLDFSNSVYHSSVNVTFIDLEGELQQIIRYANGTIDIITSTSTVRISNFTRKIIVGFPSFWDTSYEKNLLEFLIVVQDKNENYGIGIEESVVSISKFDVKITYEDSNCIDMIATGVTNATVIPRTAEEYKIPDWYDIPGWVGLIQKLFADFLSFVSTLFNAFVSFVLFIIDNSEVLLTYAQVFLIICIIGVAGLTVYNPGLAFTVIYTVVEIATKVFRLLYNAIMKVAQFILELIPL